MDYKTDFQIYGRITIRIWYSKIMNKLTKHKSLKYGFSGISNMRFHKYNLASIFIMILIFSSVYGATAGNPDYLITRIKNNGTGNGQFNALYDVIIVDEKYYVVDFSLDRVQIFDTNWNYIDQFGGSGSGLGQLNGPISLYYNGTYIFVPEYSNDRISIFDTDGNYVAMFGESGINLNQIYRPVSVTTHDDLIFVTDSGNSRVQVYNATTLEYLITYNPSQIDLPYGISFYDGILYVCDATAGTVVMLDATTGHYVGDAINYPSNAIGSSSNPISSRVINDYLVVTDSNNQAVNIYDLTGVLVDHITANLLIPNGFIIHDNQIIISEVDGNRITVLRAVANPHNVEIISGDYGNIITWEIDQSVGATSILHYNIYRDDGNRVYFIGQTTTKSYTDVAVHPGDSYTYLVEAVSTIATSDRISSEQVTFEGPSMPNNDNTGNVTTVIASNSGIFSGLPVKLLPILSVLVVIPLIKRRNRL